MAAAAMLLRFVDERLDHMLEAPEMWGSDESVELQILQLLEIRMFVTTSMTSPEDWRTVQADYERFLDEQLPGSPPTTLAARLGGERRREISPLLATFVARRRQLHPVNLVADRNRDEIQTLERLLAVARSAWETERERRDTHGSKRVRLASEPS
jgi:hypothetical protein